MAKIKPITVQVNVEGLLQKELIKVVEKIQKDHDLMIDNINFQWSKSTNGIAKVVRCETRNSYEA